MAEATYYTSLITSLSGTSADDACLAASPFCNIDLQEETDFFHYKLDHTVPP